MGARTLAFSMPKRPLRYIDPLSGFLGHPCSMKKGPEKGVIEWVEMWVAAQKGVKPLDSGHARRMPCPHMQLRYWDTQACD